MENFLERSKEHHGNKYDYSKVVTLNVMSKVIIICPDHDPPREWSQLAHSHINGKGCRLCSGYEKNNKGHFFYKKLKKNIRIDSITVLQTIKITIPK